MMKTDSMDANFSNNPEGESFVIRFIYTFIAVISGVVGWTLDNLETIDIVTGLFLKIISILSIFITILLNWPKLKEHFNKKISRLKNKKQ